jgi:cell division protein FtsZ
VALTIIERKKGQQAVFKGLRDGLEGRNLKATLRLYLGGLLVLAPAAAFIGYLLGTQAAFQVTPLLVLILVGVEYGLCYAEKILRIIPRHRPNSSLMPSTTLQAGGTTPEVKIIGVGGAGGSAINTMIEAGLSGVELVAANTDHQALDSMHTAIRLQLGAHLTKGLGAGANPEIGRKAAQEDREAIVQALEGADMVFVIAGLGGGTGSGAAPVIARAAREKGILTVAIVTKPFAFEGRQRMRQAEAAIHELRSHVDALIVISNQLLLEVTDKRTSLRAAFKVVDDTLRQAVQGITDLVTVSGAFNLADLRKFMSGMGVGSLGIGVAHGEKRAEEAMRQALSSPLLAESPIAKAHRVLINVTGGPGLSPTEVHKAVSLVHDVVREDASIIFGSITNESVRNEVRVTIIAADFGTDTTPAPSKQPSPSGKCIAFKYTTGTILIDSPAEPRIGSPIR